MASAVVPNVIGFTVEQAAQVGFDAGVLLLSHDPDGPALHTLSCKQSHVVHRQHPAAGTEVQLHAPVTVWCAPRPAVDLPAS